MIEEKKDAEKEVRYFQCQKCGCIIKLKDDSEMYVKPLNRPEECYEDQGGCGRKSYFRELRKEWIEKNRKRTMEKI